MTWLKLLLSMSPFGLNRAAMTNFVKSKMENLKAVTGAHVLGDIRVNNVQALKNLNATRDFIANVIKKFKLCELGSFYHQFEEGGGFTGVVCLSESHVAIHTWPELEYLTLDVYLCNYSRDNRDTCNFVFDEISNYFEPREIKKQTLER